MATKGVNTVGNIGRLIVKCISRGGRDGPDAKNSTSWSLPPVSFLLSWVAFLTLGLFALTGGFAGDRAATSDTGPALTRSFALNLVGQPAMTNLRLENQIETLLDHAGTRLDFTLMITADNGRTFVYNKGRSSPDLAYESASTSKLVSAAIIMEQVRKGFLSLNDSPKRFNIRFLPNVHGKFVTS